jgi:signal transduction histidine kinase
MQHGEIHTCANYRSIKGTVGLALKLLAFHVLVLAVISMSLRNKYLLVLNGIITAMWIMYTAWSLRETEQQFMKAEMSSIKHLAIGIGLLVEHQLENNESVVSLQKEMASLLPHKTGLDIMIVDKTFKVKMATQEDLIGKEWFEETIQEVLEGQREKFEVVVTQGEHLHVDRRVIDATIAVRSSTGEITHAVHVARWLDHLSGALNKQLVSHGLFALAMLVIIGVAVNLLTYRIILRPLRVMNSRLNESGWLSSHPELKGGSELEQLQAVLNDALTRIDHHTTSLNERLKRSERLAVIGRMASMLAHEIRNPLHIVRGTAETISRRFPESGEFSKDINEEVDRVERLIEELLDYSRDTPLRLEDVDADSLLETVVARVKRTSSSGGNGQYPPTQIQFSNVRLKADSVMLEQALSNLLLNAVEASTSSQPITMRAKKLPDDNVLFEVVDAGQGIANEDLEKSMEPFFTRKARGTGLGLAIVNKISDLHGGSIFLSRRDEGGTRANLIIPQPRGKAAS